MSDIFKLLTDVTQEVTFLINEIETIAIELNEKNIEIENLKTQLKKITQLNTELQSQINNQTNDYSESKKNKGFFKSNYWI